MSLQNRVDPWGEIHAVAERGNMMGNRGGKFHRDDRTLGKRRWASRHWICCDLHWKGLHHEPMGQGYTSLFFLDEVTALAAGHRPCFFCRRKEAKAFLGEARVEDFDRVLHVERLAPKTVADLRDLPDGAMVEIDGAAFAVRGPNLLRWSFAGYVERMPRKPSLHGSLLTCAAITAILRAGYKPRWHMSANQWGTR
ncbi:hypothetical protein [Aestuariivirga sp.]|uniref:hypothetical protein n=1 Tax=Aestuariivirga sp. TaxID=2650926 RepID=UPI003593E13C